MLLLWGRGGVKHRETLKSLCCGFQSWVYITIPWELFLKQTNKHTQISGLHAPKIDWPHSLWTDRTSEWTALLHNSIVSGTVHHLGWKGRTQFITLLQGHCWVSFRTFEWFSPHRLISLTFKLLLTAMVEASCKTQCLLQYIQRILSFRRQGAEPRALLSSLCRLNDATELMSVFLENTQPLLQVCFLATFQLHENCFSFSS